MNTNQINYSLKILPAFFINSFNLKKNFDNEIFTFFKFEIR